MEDFDNKTSVERVVLEFDFAGITLDALAVLSMECVCVKGTDPNSAAMLSGAATVSGQAVLQLVIGGLHRCDYIVTAHVVTAAGVPERFDLSGRLKVRNPVPVY